jgi:hypothetical protein
MIVWQGMGFIVIIIAFGCCLLLDFLTGKAFLDRGYYAAHGWPKLLALWLAAAITWALSRYAMKKEGRVLIDKYTGEEVIFRPQHSLFFINIAHWAYILFAAGIVFFFVRD